jgi:pimeloyl-ACP methyl ester carboxylesterase
MWGLQLGHLQRLGSVLAPDLPGFGAEGPLPAAERTPEGYADWVAGWLGAHGVGSCSVVGYSMGGTLALLLAARHPHRVRRLVAACASPCWALGWRGPLARFAFDALGGIAVEAFRQSVLWAYARYGKDPAHKPILEDMARKAHAPTMLALCRELARADYRWLLPAVRAHTLVVGGSWDHLVPPSHIRSLAAGLPKGELRVLRGATHLLCLARPQEFADILVDFLRRPETECFGEQRAGNGAD